MIGLGSKRRDRAYGKVITSGKITHAELIARTEIFAGEWARRLGRAPGKSNLSRILRLGSTRALMTT